MKQFVIFSLALLSLTGCLRPKKPVVTLCTIDYEQDEAICGLTGEGANTIVKRVPLSDLDKGTAFNALNWAKVSTYMKDMEGYIKFLEQRKCR